MNTYNKEEVMKEAHTEALSLSKNAKDCREMIVLPVGNIGRLLGKYLDAAFQAGDKQGYDRGNTDAYGLVERLHQDGFCCTCRCEDIQEALEALK